MCVYLSFWLWNLHILNSTQTYTHRHTHTHIHMLSLHRTSTAHGIWSCRLCTAQTRSARSERTPQRFVYFWCSFPADTIKCLEEGVLFCCTQRVPDGLAVALDSCLPLSLPKFCLGRLCGYLRMKETEVQMSGRGPWKQ